MNRSIKQILVDATEAIRQSGSTTPRLDAEVLLSHVLNNDRCWLVAHDDHELSDSEISSFNELIKQRTKSVPIAYLTGYKEFYGRDFKVSPNVLIPRPESETIIDLLKEHPTALQGKPKLVDVGTGSGCLGITAKLEIPELEVSLIDISSSALDLARENAKTLNADVSFILGDLLENYHQKADIIIANLPYVDRDWQVSTDTQHEPDLALFARENGLELINKLIVQIPSKIKKDGFILIEADPRQHEEIIDHASKNNLQVIKVLDFIVALSPRKHPV
ncbi:protein-(glutamine-N5) methyltransferase, release factor-specific [Candidatus Saccharibacteria bacterium]|nr:MAG: protein-(glutamine-N5) methyltransferase, release factor-specific [Candidatus Saccharibacteria bacterium]